MDICLFFFVSHSVDVKISLFIFQLQKESLDFSAVLSRQAVPPAWGSLLAGQRNSSAVFLKCSNAENHLPGVLVFCVLAVSVISVILLSPAQTMLCEEFGCKLTQVVENKIPCENVCKILSSPLLSHMGLQRSRGFAEVLVCSTIP